jgi:two-component system sensor histidine kinase NreB
MAQRVITAQEEERRRISRELHDDLGQALTAHKLTLHNLQADLPKEHIDLQRRMDLIITETSDLISQVRQLSQQLRPPILDTLGFATATNTYCTEFGRRSGIHVQNRIDSELGEIPDVHTITLYRVLQEALTNISRHSKAETVWVDLFIEDDRLCLMVQDNGIGFNIETEQKNGIGILSIRERLALVGGQLDLRSRVGHGTILSAYVPYKNRPVVTKES